MLRILSTCIVVLFVCPHVIQAAVNSLNHIRCSPGGLTPREVFSKLNQKKVPITDRDMQFSFLGGGLQGVVQDAVFRDCKFVVKRPQNIFQLILLQKEISLTKELAHEYVVEVLGDVPGMMPMPKYDHDLTRVRVQNGYSIKQILHYLYNILDGLEHVHNKGYIHSDLKPENILISKAENKAVLADFGLANVEHNMLLGLTPDYAPLATPRRFEVTRADDVFAFGQIMKYVFGAKVQRRRPRQDFDLAAENLARGHFRSLNPFLYDEYSDLWKSQIKIGPKRLIEACTQENAFKRPTVPEIRKKLKAFEGKFDKRESTASQSVFSSIFSADASKASTHSHVQSVEDSSSSIDQKPFVFDDCSKLSTEVGEIELRKQTIDSKPVSVVDFKIVMVGKIIGYTVKRYFWSSGFPIYRGQLGGCSVFIHFTNRRETRFYAKEKLRIPYREKEQYEDLNVVAVSYAEVNGKVPKKENFLIYQATSDGYPVTQVATKEPNLWTKFWNMLKCPELFPAEATISRPKITQTKLFIDGQFVNAESEQTFQVLNPSTEEVIANVAEADAADVDKAVAAARKAFDHGPWPKMSGRQRGRLIYKLSQLIKENAEELAALEALDNGKPIEDAKGDVFLSWDHFEYYAGWADKIQGKTIPVDGDFFSYTIHEPIGVCGAVIPWNFPLLMAAWKLAPALATGNVMVLKPAEQTPLSALRLAELIQEAGIPDGVVNILPGYGPTAGAALARHMDVDKVAFTGSTEVGKKIMAMSAESNLKPVSLELGGKSAAIVLDDVEDLDKAVEGAHFALYFNQGQCCCAGSRLFVQEKIYDEFVEKMVAKVKKTVVGDGFNATTTQGPQVNQEQFDKIMYYIEEGKRAGAKLVIGGGRIGNKGYFIQPTIFTDVQDNMKIAQDEIFGPVMNILKFKSLEEVVERANESFYGLAAGVWTSNIDKANTIARGLKAGSVWINCYDNFDSAIPFGGYKMSGIGRDKGEYALKNYLQVKCITTPLIQPATL